MTKPTIKMALCIAAIMLSAACLVTAILGEWLAIVPAILSGVSAGGAWQQIKREKTT